MGSLKNELHQLHNDCLIIASSGGQDPASTPRQAHIAMGKIVFTNRCGNCHDLPKPEQYTTQRWEGILSYMIPRARLNEEQGVHVTAYLKANAVK